MYSRSHASQMKWCRDMEKEEKKRHFSKKKILILAVVIAAAALAAAGILLYFRSRTGGVHVESVASIMSGGQTDAGNRFAGVVESEKSWSVKTTAGSVVGKVYVEVGDTVKKGDPLFKYDTDKIKDTLEQSEIDLQRMQNEKKSINDTITELTKEKNSASAQEQGEYTVQIQEQQLEAGQIDADIKKKESEIKKLKESEKNATVKSEIDGVVKSINSGDTADMAGDQFDEEIDETDAGEESAEGETFMTILQTSKLRVRASVNEQNIADLEEGTEVTVHSRVDDSTWDGVISRIDLNGAAQNQGDEEMYIDEESESDDETSSSSYPFYVELNTSDGLMLGQHVYVEPASGMDGIKHDGIWLDEAYLVDADSDDPYVWADNGKGRLTRQKVEVGEYDEESMEYEILSGLSEQDRIAVPTNSLRKGVKIQ